MRFDSSSSKRGASHPQLAPLNSTSDQFVVPHPTIRLVEIRPPGTSSPIQERPIPEPEIEPYPDLEFMTRSRAKGIHFAGSEGLGSVTI